MGVLAEGIPFEAVVYNTMKSQEKQMYFFPVYLMLELTRERQETF